MKTIETETGRQKCSDKGDHDQGSSDECVYCAEYLNGKADGRAEATRYLCDRIEEALRLLDGAEMCEDASGLFDLCVNARKVLRNQVK